MAITTLDLVIRAMRDRGILGATEVPTALDADYVKGVYIADLEELRDNNIAYWPEDQVPDAIVRALSHRLGLLIGDAFGFPRASEMEIEASLRPLRKHLSKRASGEPVQGCYF
ncbi:MAG: hypothetical protein AAFQ35_07150 [Pseudomonadota bacterium]